MPYCYACRNTKPATHAHFLDHGILAMRPPKRHITEIEALWDSMTQPEQARALEEGRQFLAQSDTQAPRGASASAHTSRGTSNTGATGKRQQAQTREKDEGSPWGLIAVGAIFLSGIGWVIYQGIRGA